MATYAAPVTPVTARDEIAQLPAMRIADLEQAISGVSTRTLCAFFLRASLAAIPAIVLLTVVAVVTVAFLAAFGRSLVSAASVQPTTTLHVSQPLSPQATTPAASSDAVPQVCRDFPDIPSCKNR